MNARDIQKWKRTKELAEKRGIEIKLGENFWFTMPNQETYMAHTLDEAYGFVVGFNWAKFEVNP